MTTTENRRSLEEWRAVEGWPYEVSNLGNVRRIAGSRRCSKAHRPLALKTDSRGYHHVDFSKDGKHTRYWVARLVCRAFNGPPPSDRYEIRHLDGVKTNNVPSNLRWGTRSENAEDRRQHGTMPMGERHKNSKMTDAEVATVRADAMIAKIGRSQLPDGWLYRQAEKYGVGYGCIQSIVAGTNR
jgi:hypothetical protein